MGKTVQENCENWEKVFAVAYMCVKILLHLSLMEGVKL
jgi:hypothetical protein